MCVCVCVCVCAYVCVSLCVVWGGRFGSFNMIIKSCTLKSPNTCIRTIHHSPVAPEPFTSGTEPLTSGTTRTIHQWHRTTHQWRQDHSPVAPGPLTSSTRTTHQWHQDHSPVAPEPLTSGTRTTHQWHQNTHQWHQDHSPVAPEPLTSGTRTTHQWHQNHSPVAPGQLPPAQVLHLMPLVLRGMVGDINRTSVLCCAALSCVGVMITTTNQLINTSLQLLISSGSFAP